MNRKGKHTRYIIIIIILLIMDWIAFNEYMYIQTITEKTTYDVSKTYISETEQNMIQPQKEYPKEKIVKEYKGFNVSAKLEIPAIELETYILENFSESALNVSVTKFWGSAPNQIGNLCVAGHNFKNKNMFKNLKKLEVGDTFTITDNDIGKVQYKIYDIYKVSPNDISCLSQETNNLREVTLITCTSDSKQRIIVKAREVI